MNIKNRKIFITGGCGFIGSAIIQRLAPYNELIIYDNGRRNALKFFLIREHKNIRIIRGDILDAELLKNSIKGCDTVIHLAAMAGVSSYYTHPIKTMEVNFLGTYNILNAVKDNNELKLFINFSTSEVYGPYAEKVNENQLTSQGSLQDLRWTYSVSKLAAEHLVFAFGKEYKLPVISLRPFNIYGPGQIGEGAIQIFINKALKNEELCITGTGNQIRAWCYVDDLIDALISCMEKKEAIGHTFNIGNSGVAISIYDLAKEIIKATKSTSSLKFVPHQGTDIQVRIPDISKAQRMLDYSPKVDLTKGLSLTIDWFKKFYINHHKDEKDC